MRESNTMRHAVTNNAPRPLATQRGALLLATLLILMVISILAMSSVDTTGLEMQMSSNSRLQQQTFEAAEYTLSWAENSIKAGGYFTDASLTNDVSNAAGNGACGTTCFSSACTNGYCFNGNYAPGDDWDECELTIPATEPYADPDIWEDDSDKHQTLTIPNSTMTAKYIVEFMCYTARDTTMPMDDDNHTPMYRVTAFVVSEGSRARVMLRSTVKES